MVRFGYIHNNTFDRLTQVNVIGEKVIDTINCRFAQNKRATSSYKNLNRIKVDVELDLQTPTQLAAIRQRMYEAWAFTKVYMKHPSGTDQLIDFNNSAASKFYHIASNTSSLAYTDGATEATAGEYTAIKDINSSKTYYNSSALNYTYMFFNMVCTADLSVVQRVSLLLHNPYFTGVLRNGFKVDVYNQTEASWTEISRTNYTLYGSDAKTIVNDDFKVDQHFAVLKPGIEGFTNFTDYAVDGTFYFRMRNLQAPLSSDVTKVMQIGINYACLLIDGFPVSYTGPYNFNYREPFTGVGQRGTLTLEELS